MAQTKCPSSPSCSYVQYTKTVEAVADKNINITETCMSAKSVKIKQENFLHEVKDLFIYLFS